MGCRARYLAALAVASPFVWASPSAAAPPAAHDFEQRLSGVERVHAKGTGHGEDGPVTHRSAVIAAPARFDAVGLAGELRPLEIRARPAGGTWSEWIEVGGGDPLYVVGGADDAQLRTRGWRPRGRLHYVDITGAGSRPDGGASASDRAAKGEVPKPDFITRRGWGAGDCPPRTEASTGVTKSVVVHHTVTSNTYSRAEARGIVLAICRYHRNGNGWNDIGYNALVDRFGRLYEGRAGGLRRSVVGAHAEGYNAQTSGIASIADHTSAGVGDARRGAIARFIAWKLSVNGHRPKDSATLASHGGSSNRYSNGTRLRVSRVIGHRRVGLTACPGDHLYGELERIRRIAQRIQREHRT